MEKWVFKIAVYLTALTAVTAVSPALAQRSLLFPAQKSFETAYYSGHYREALELARKSIEMAENTKLKKGEMAGLLGDEAEAMRALGLYKESEETFKKALIAGEAEPTVRNKNIILPTIYLDLPAIYEVQGRYGEAEAMWQQCYFYTRKNLAFCYLPSNHLAKLYTKWGKMTEAAKYIQISQDVAKKKPNPKASAFSHFTTGTFLQAKGQYKQAESEFEQALADCATAVGKSHPYYAKMLMEQSDLFREESRFTEAENCLSEALKINQTLFSNEYPDVAEIMVRKALVLSEEGRYNEGLDLAQKGLDLELKIYSSPDNPYICQAKLCLGNILRQEGRYQEALDYITQARDSQRKFLGKDTIDVAITLRNLAMVQEELANFKEAEALFKESLDIINQQTGPDHPQRADANRALAHFYLNQGKYDQAEPLLKEALELSEKVLGENHVVTAGSAQDLGDLYAKEKKYDDSAKYLQKALNIDEQLYGAKAPQVAADLMNLAIVYGAGGKADLAGPLLQRAADIKNVLPGGGIAQEDAVPSSSAKDRPVTDKWALVIGISSFKDPTINLKYAAKDATDFKNFLITHEHFKADHVKLLTDANANRENIYDMLGDKWLGHHAHPDDLVVVYVSSHGSQAQDATGHPNFLVAHDTNKYSLLATGIPMQWLTKIISEGVHSDRVILILDVCHSGSATQGSKGLDRKQDVGVDPKQFKIGSGQMVICSSSADQVSWESKNYENSVFTRKLMEALQTNQDKTTMLQAFKQLKVLVETEVLRDRGDLQTPVILSKTWTGKDPMLAIDVQAGRQVTK